MKTAATLIAAVAVAVLLSWFGPTVLDNSGEYAAADDAIRSERAATKLMNAAKEMCGGENTVAQLHTNGQWECFNKQGRKTALKGMP